jgi:hypothetical protein
MITSKRLLGILDPFNNKKSVLVPDQTTGDIIQAILNGHDKYRSEYKKISSFFKGSNNKETAHNVWKFLKQHVKYKVEPENEQRIKSPAAIVATGHTIGSDCKNYSLFTAGILDALKIPFAFRFASYSQIGDKTPGHVFVVIYPGTTHEVWVDAVLRAFDYHKPYTYKIDKTPKKMAIVAMSGIGASRTIRKARHARRKAAGKTFGQKLKKGLKAIVKVAAAPVRNAFLLLIKVNFHNLAKKLAVAYNKHPEKVKNFWESAGGRINNLVKQINKGKTKKRILGHEAGIYGIGIVDPATQTATLVTAAAPLLAKVAKLLKSIGIDPKELVNIAKDAISDRAKEAFAQTLAPKAAQEQEYADEAEQYQN